MRSLHGTDCFEVEAFIARTDESKVFKVRHKTSGYVYLMEVAPRKNSHRGPTDTTLQETLYHLSKFWVNLKFTFQTSSKLYYILDYIGETTLQSLCLRHGPMSEIVVQFYASEVLNALEELHSHGYMYGELGLDKVIVDSTGHVVLWRTFCGQKYWTREECVCSMYGFNRGNMCENTHGKSTERDLKIDFQLLGLAILQLFSKEYFTSMLNNKDSPQESLSQIASSTFNLPSSLSVFARDLVTRLLKGQFYNSSHVKTHPFFTGVNWKMVNSRLTTPPSIPRKVSFPPPLRKSSSEARIYVEPTPPPYVRPSTSIMSGYSNDQSMAGYQYAHSPPSQPPQPQRPRMLRSTLSFPDLSTFGRESEPSPWTRIQPVHPSYHDHHYGDSQGRFSAQSMCDLTSISDNGCLQHGRQRTSSSPDAAINYISYDHSPPERRISHNMSYPPGNPSFFNQQHNDYNFHGSYGNTGTYDGRCTPQLSYNAPAIYGDGYSHNTANRYYSNDVLHNTQFATGPGSYHVIDDGRRKSRETMMPSLHRAQSCSQLDVIKSDAEQRRIELIRPPTPTIENSERRKHYPLAQVPIPSFAEFKRKNSRVNEEAHESTKVTEVRFQPIESERIENQLTNTSEINSRSCENKETKFEHKLIESRKSESELTNSSRENVPQTNSTTNNENKQPKSIIKTTRNEPTKDKPNDYYSHNDVIHNLMVKYGLYERSEKKREARITGSTSKDKGNDTTPKLKSFLEENTNKDRDTDTVAKVKSFLESRKQTEASTKTETEDKSVTRRDIMAARRSPKAQRRRASAMVEQHTVDPPKLTRKSKSTLGPNSLSPVDITEDINNNKKTTVNSSERSKTVEDAMEKAREHSRKTTQSTTCSEDRKAKLQEEVDEIIAKATRRTPIDIAEILKKRKSSSIREELSSSSSPTLGLARYKELASSKSDLLSIADVYKTSKQATSASSSPVPPDDISSTDNNDKSPKTSRTLWAAAKFKLKLGKSPTNSPLMKRKDKNNIDINDAKLETKKDGAMLSPRVVRDLQVVDNVDRRDSLEPPSPGPLQKNGLHTSLLSISSSIYSTDNEEYDDSSSIHSVDERSVGSRRRWESFHSNVSADSGSAHLYDFENDSMEDPFDDNQRELELIRKKTDSDIERADSGIGGDVGRHNKKSWEDIVLKSSRRWSVVAATAKRWQEVAHESKLAKEVGTRRKSLTPVITEDMVECPECQKYYIPEPESSERQSGKSSPAVCAKCTERRVERKEAIIELVQTEINYANDLQILKEEFYSPLQSGGILQPDQLAEIFLNLQELLEVSTKFSSRLQKALEESVTKGNEEFSQVNVGSIFLESVEFFQSYEIYCTKQNAASTLLESLQKKNELLKIFLNVTCRENPKCRKMDLNSFLLAPIQRIMKYPLLLSRIRKATPRRNADREKLMQAQRKIEDQLNRINALNSTVESRQKRYRGSGHLGRSDSLDKLQMKKMASEILNWTMGEMHLLMHGVFEVVIHEFISSSGWSRRGSKRTTDVFMLFCVLGMSEPQPIDSDDDNNVDEPLFPTDADATDAALVMLKKKMNGKYTLFKEPLSLNTCIICKNSEHKDCFELINMSRETYIFKAQTIKESKKWLKHLRLQAKDLGTWKKRRNGLPNIMIKTI